MKLILIIKFILLALITLFQINFVHADNSLEGEYKFGKNKFGIFNVDKYFKIKKNSSGVYAILGKDADNPVWVDLHSVRPASDEELEEIFPNRRNRVENSLLITDERNNHMMGFFKIKPGMIGNTLITKTTVFVSIINKQGIYEIEKIDINESEPITIDEKIIDKLYDKKPEPIVPYMLNRVTNANLKILHRLNDPVVEWYYTVRDVKKINNTYIIYSEAQPPALLTPKSLQEGKNIENITPGTRIKIRGHLLINTEMDNEMRLDPSVLINDPGIAGSELAVVESLKSIPSSEILPLEKFIKEVCNPNITSLQKSILKEKYKDKYVEGYIGLYMNYGNSDVFDKLNAFEHKMSFNYRDKESSRFGRRVVIFRTIITLNNDDEYTKFHNNKGEVFTHLVRGKVDLSFANSFNGGGPQALISPAVIINQNTIKPAVTESAIEKPIHNSTNHEIKQGTKAAITESRTLDSSSHNPEHNENNGSLNTTSITKNEINKSKEPPLLPETAISRVDTSLQSARAELEIEKIKLERERNEFEREKLRMQSQLNSESKLVEPTNIDGEFFTISITKNDIHNSKGLRITDPVLILMQDRANVHRFGNPDGDNVDQFFSLAENRAKIRSFLERGSFPQDIQQSILSGNGVKLRIRVYSNDEGKNSVDVSYEGAQGDATSDFLPDQTIMTFIDSESNFRMEPSVNSAVKFQPRKGATGLVLERRDKWVKIELENGDIGWAHESNLEKDVKSQDFVEPGIEQTKQVFTDGENKFRNLSGVKSYWNHNGSVMGLIPEGNQRTFVYVKPRRGLQDIVSPGIVLFSGKTDGKSYEGVARRFSKGLPSINYSVAGPISNNGSQVVLRGQFILRDKDVAQSEIINDVLVFDLLPSE